MSGPDRRAMLAGGAALVGAGLAGRARGQGAPLPSYPGGDVALLKHAYDALHPGLLRYQTQAQSDARFAALGRAWDAAPDRRARYLALSRHLATIRCGHSYANFYNQSKPVQRELFEARDRLPFQFRWLGSRMVVTSDPTGAGLAPGTEVLAIEGRPAGEILAGLMTVARADGHTDGKRRILMSVQGTERYESFDVYYPLLFGGRDHYRMSLRTPDGRVSDRTVQAIGFEQRLAQRASEAAEPDAPQWRYERRGATAVITMPTWALFNSKWDWKAWTDARFVDMAQGGVDGLVLDVRGNEGGLDCGDALIAHLIGEPLRREASVRLVRYRSAPPELKRYLDTWDPSFLDWGAAAVPLNGRYFRLDQKEDDGREVGEVRPSGVRFRGKVAVLIGPQNSSATYGFAAAIRRAKLGVLVGEETGGNQRGINGGAFFFLRLPQSGLEADLPLIGQFPDGPRPDRGLAPDVLAPQTAASIAAGQDVAMARALELVRG